MTAQAQAVWNSCQERISSELPPYTFNTWIRPLKALSIKQDSPQILYVEVPSQFHQQWLVDNFSDLVGDSVQAVLGPGARLEFSINTHVEEVEEEPAHAITATATATTAFEEPLPHPQSLHQAISRAIKEERTPPPNLNPNYTLEDFVEGDGNRLARGAALAVAKNPGSTRYNPLFLYGDVGLGKTHLAQAICNHAFKHRTARHPVYVSSDSFTTQFITAIRTNKTHEFTAFYREVDLLVVDDIQFLSGKERTQEEFFHLFNSIHQSGGQIVLCADRPPGEIQGIHARLVSRFQWGLAADITAPDYETRVAILYQKASRQGLNLPQSITDTIARAVSTNVRELESVLTKLLAHSTLHNTSINEGLVTQVLSDYGKIKVHLSLDAIVQYVSEEFGVPPDTIVGKSRKREVVIARHTAMYLAKESTHRSLKSIGLHFAGRDHSTVIHAIKTVQHRLEQDSEFQNKIISLQRTLKRKNG